MTLPPARALLVFGLLLAAFVNVHGLVLTMRAHARFRESAFDTVRARVLSIRSALGQRVAMGGGYEIEAAVRQAAAGEDWEAVEAFTPAGKLLMANPRPSPVRHWMTAAEMESAREGAVLVGAEPSRLGHRIVAYAYLAGPNEAAVLRFTAESPELAADWQDRQQSFLGHTATLLALILVGGIAMTPRAVERAAAPPRALMAYEEAMERLRDHGDEQTERHQAERRQMEGILRDKEAMARAGELTAGIVHEMRNGLGTILGYARLIENGSDAPPDNARRIREECETLESVIALFLDFVKRETLTLGTVEVGPMLQRVVARESRRPGPPVEIDAAGAGSVRADDGMLERAFENLVRNAREAAGPAGTVRVSARREGEWVRIQVADDGPGLEPGTRARLRPFFSTKSGGLGLGLPIALKIIRLHDGDLTFGDRVPKGAEVSVRLPVGGPSATGTLPIVASDHAQEAEGKGNGGA